MTSSAASRESCPIPRQGRWLAGLWNGLTAMLGALSREDVRQALVERARMLASDLGRDYVLWLERKCRGGPECHCLRWTPIST